MASSTPVAPVTPVPRTGDPAPTPTCLDGNCDGDGNTNDDNDDNGDSNADSEDEIVRELFAA